MNQNPILNLIQDLLNHESTMHLKTACFFDLDSTLFDLNQRQLNIFKDFASQENFKSKYPLECNAFLNMQEQHLSYYPEDCLIKFGLETISKHFSEDFHEYWKVRFFSDQYMHWDRLETGAEQIIKKLRDWNIQLFFLTGRDEARMGKATRDQLQKHLKLSNEQIQQEVIVKPHLSLLDDQFKLDIVKSKIKDFPNIVFIDNEELNLQVIHQELPNVKLVLFDSVHSGKGKAPQNIPVIKNFL